MNTSDTIGQADNDTLELSRETIAGGILAGNRNILGLTKTERYYLRVAIEELMAQGCDLNDILHVCGASREFYFYQIDKVRELPEEKQPDAPRPQEMKAEHRKRLTYNEQLNVIDQVDHLRYIVNLDLRDACMRSNISLNRYYKLTYNRRKILDAIRRGFGNTSDAPKRKRRMRIPDGSDPSSRLTCVEKIRKQLVEGANLGDILVKGAIPMRLYFKWANEAEQAATKHEQADGDAGVSTLKLWQDYEADKQNIQARNALVAHYLPMVKTMAEKVSLSLPKFVSVNDLVQEGIFGLLDAIEGFDPARGKSFRVYTIPRIWGQMMDFLRGEDWVPKETRQKHNHARDGVSNDANGSQNQEHAQGQSSNGDRFTLPKMISTSKPVGSDDERSLGETLADEAQGHPEKRMEKQDLLRFILKGCNRNERLIMIMYYYEELTMKEIGESLDLTESRVSQMHSAVVTRQNQLLRKRFRESQRF
jgi:RNA polymerase sigma factor for flagellar operon FliA